METIKKKLVLGKIAYDNPRRKTNVAELDLELRWRNGGVSVDNKPLPGHWVLSICGTIWNSTQTDCSSCGQNYARLAEFFSGNKRFDRIVEIWNRWHLNDMKGGTRAQNAAVAAWLAAGNAYDYTRIREHLKSLGLEVDGGYTYGTGWMVDELPVDVRNEIIALFDAPVK